MREEYNSFRSLLKEAISEYLNEMVSPIVWHYCWIDNLLSILESNTFELSKSEVDREQLPGVIGFSPKRPYYLCTTRSRLSNDGYSQLVTNDNQEGYVRIQFDGNALNNIAHGKASDYFGTRDKPIVGKRAFFKELEKGDNRYLQRHNKENEREDTVWFNKDTLKNANKYIQRIDVCVPNEMSFNELYEKLVKINSLANNLNIPIFFYTNSRDFDQQNNQTFSLEESNID